MDMQAGRTIIQLYFIVLMEAAVLNILNYNHNTSLNILCSETHLIAHWITSFFGKIKKILKSKTIYIFYNVK